MPELLFAEDENVLGRLVVEALEREPDYKVTWVRDGQQALLSFRNRRPDLCIIDVMMPQMDGFELARHLRAADAQLPILFLTARSQTADVVKGFESGGNDYLRKPFSIQELILRTRELLRRGQALPAKTPDSTTLFRIGKYRFDAPRQVLTGPEGSYSLSFKEAALLRELLLHKNEVLERKAVLLQLWGEDNFFNARNMDVYISKLRKYLSQDAALSIINVRGLGFKLTEQSDADITD